jgi:hypothetical protein
VRDVNPYEYDDPTNPPPGYKAIECPDCSLDYLKPSDATKMALGPIPGLSTRAHRSASLCTVCRGRTWVWSPLAPEIPHSRPDDTSEGTTHPGD